MFDCNDKWKGIKYKRSSHYSQYFIILYNGNFLTSTELSLLFNFPDLEKEVIQKFNAITTKIDEDICGPFFYFKSEDDVKRATEYLEGLYITRLLTNK